MPHNLTHITAAIRASGRTTTHGAILLAEVDRLRAWIAALTVDDADADPQVAAMVNASGHTIDDSTLILTELNRIGWTVRPITGLLDHQQRKPPLTGYRVFWSAEDEEWVGLSITYPSLSHLAETPEAAIRGIIELLQSVALDELAETALETNGCCHKTRLREAPCPVGRECPFIKETANV